MALLVIGGYEALRNAIYVAIIMAKLTLSNQIWILLQDKKKLMDKCLAHAHLINELMALHSTAKAPAFARYYHPIDRDFVLFYRQEMVYRVTLLKQAIRPMRAHELQIDGDVDRQLQKLLYEIDYIYCLLKVHESDFAVQL